MSQFIVSYFGDRLKERKKENKKLFLKRVLDFIKSFIIFLIYIN